MRKIMKRIGIIAAGLVGVLIVLVLVLQVIGASRLGKTYDVQADAVAIPTDAAAIARGQHLGESIGCTGCHLEDLSGGFEFSNDAVFGTLYSTNLTPGTGGIGEYSDADLVRAIRHGVSRDGRGLAIMPSEAVYHMSDEDLGTLIAYLRTLPAVDAEHPATNMNGVLARILAVTGGFATAPELIAAQGARVSAAPEGATTEYGLYLTSIASCTICHGPNLSGAQPGDPASPPAPNLTPGGELIGWSETDFVTAIRTGVTPTGRELQSDVMPWKDYANFTDEELSAIWAYLNSLEALPTNG